MSCDAHNGEWLHDPREEPEAGLEPAPETPRQQESTFDFYTRRALEEAMLARQAKCRRAATAHAYLAASYSARLARELAEAPDLDDLVRRIA